MKIIVNNGPDAWKIDINLFLTITNCKIVCSLSLTHGINYKFVCLLTYWQWKLANEHARISVVIVKNLFLVCSYNTLLLFLAEVHWNFLATKGTSIRPLTTIITNLQTVTNCSERNLAKLCTNVLNTYLHQPILLPYCYQWLNRVCTRTVVTR